MRTKGSFRYDTGIEPFDTEVDMERSRLRKQIEGAINSVSAENGSNTPDFILAEYMTGCLFSFDRAVNAREKWYGRPEAARPLPPTIAELEAILNDPNPGKVEVMPDGSIRTDPDPG